MNPHPVLLSDSMPIKEAVHLMLDKDVAGAPVVDASGKLVGVLSEKDLMYKGAGTPADHWIIPPVFIGALDAYVSLRDNKKIEEESHKILAKTVREAMSADAVHYVTPRCTMAKAAQLMIEHDINLLPVQEADGVVVGVITRHDILRGIYASNNAFL